MNVKTSDVYFALGTIFVCGGIIALQRSQIKQLKHDLQGKGLLTVALSRISLKAIAALTPEAFLKVSEEMYEELKFVDIVTNK